MKYLVALCGLGVALILFVAVTPGEQWLPALTGAGLTGFFGAIVVQELRHRRDL